MPTYSFVDKKTKRTWVEFMSISEMEAKLAEHPTWDVMCGAPVIGDPVRLGRVKLDTHWNEHLKAIKRASPGSKMTTSNLGEV